VATPVRVNFEAAALMLAAIGVLAGIQTHRKLAAASATNRAGAELPFFSCRLAEWWGNLPIGMT
jgi:hypothetical protein